MKTKKQHGGVWQYLEACGILATGTPGEIETARKEYWRIYKRKWKAAQRKTFTVSLSDAEAKELVRSAKAHHTKPTTFLRQAALAYMRSSFLSPDAETLAEIRALLSKNYLLLQTILEERDLPSEASILLVQFEKLESSILQALTQPQRRDV